MIDTTNSKYAQFLIGAGVLFGLFLASLFSYALFHSLIELFSVFVAFAVFVIAWNTRSAQDNQYLLFIGTASLFWGSLDLGHTLADKQLGIFPGYGENLSMQLWVAFRYVFSLSFLIAPLFIRRKTDITGTVAVFGAITFALAASIFLKWFPRCYDEATGPTSFKIASEYLVAAITLLSLGFLVTRRSQFDSKVLRLLVLALSSSMASELSFTHYMSDYGIFNIAGHYFDLFSDWLIYQAIVVTGLTEPQKLVFRNLKLSEERLRESVATSQAILNSTNESVLLVDTDLAVIAANETAARRLGTSVDQMIGRTISVFAPPHVSQARDARIQDVIRTQMPCCFEDERQGMYFEHTFYPIFDAAGKVAKITIFSRDITKRRQADENIRRLNDELSCSVRQLEASNKELEAFSYSVSHDLRAPLRSLDGFSLALLEDYGNKLDATGRDCLERVRTASQRMARLIDDLLDLSRVSRVTLNSAQVPLSRIAEEIAARCRESDTDRRIEFAIAGNLTHAGDATLLRVALENLLGNAWKFTSGHAAGRIEFGATDRDGKRTYFVKDDGAGFDMTYVNKLFAPFQRLHTTHEFPGTGIGLATVQRIIQRHGGSIWIEGGVEQGATVYFTLG